MNFSNSLYFVLFFIGSTLVFVKPEVYTALVDMESLLYTEAEIAATLQKYLELEEQRLEKVKRLSNEYNKLYKSAINDVETFLSNPVNAYLLVKHLTTDWKVAESLINSSYGREIIENNIHRSYLKFPEDEDLKGAATALMRLQDIYLLDTPILARGNIGRAAPSLELTSGDCFEIGRQAYNKEKFYYTALWMQEALERIENENSKTSNKADILEYMAYSTFMLNNVKHAVKLTKDILDIDPNHPRAQGNLAYYTTVANAVTQKKGDDGRILIEQVPALTEKPKHYHPDFVDYERLCRGEKIMTPEEESKLKCRYLTNNHPFLLLQPAKEEELSLEPKIVVYYDVLSDSEIDEIKFLATPKLQRARVRGGDDPETYGYASYRISKNAWLDNDDHEVVKRISQRIEAITGLTADTSEDLQVVNYGIGGHYEPHYDFAQKEERDSFDSLGTGNRIATWIIYMNDVEAGGATVFPTIGVQVKPIKGSAAFWYNLFKNGDGDMDTRHAACPILAGSKWVTNKWLHVRGQEFIRPCSLDPDE